VLDYKWDWLSSLVESQLLYKYCLSCFAISWWHWNGAVMWGHDYKRKKYMSYYLSGGHAKAWAELDFWLGNEHKLKFWS